MNYCIEIKTAGRIFRADPLFRSKHDSDDHSQPEQSSSDLIATKGDLDLDGEGMASTTGVSALPRELRANGMCNPPPGISMGYLGPQRRRRQHPGGRLPAQRLRYSFLHRLRDCYYSRVLDTLSVQIDYVGGPEPLPSPLQHGRRRVVIEHCQLLFSPRAADIENLLCAFQHTFSTASFK